MTTKTSKSPGLPFGDVMLPPRYLRFIRDVLDLELNGCRGKVYLFGSRAQKTARSASDIDLAVDTAESVKTQLVRVQTAFEESEIPFTVDIIDLRSTPPAFKQAIRQTGKLIWHA